MSYASDTLIEHGIDAKGYGRLAKIVMLDPDLTLEAKAIYAYFCSYRGAGTSKVFPSRDTILRDLSIGKDSYYRHLQLLTKNGYVKISQNCQKNSTNGYVSNNYEIVEYPEKYSCLPSDASAKTLRDYKKIQESESISTAGYGNSPKMVMQDSSISVKAKGLYAYICVFAGAGYQATPSKETALNHLQISSNSYSKYAKELVDHHYLARTQDNANGQFGHITYRIVMNPSDLDPDSKSADTVSADTVIPDNNISDTVLPDINFTDTVSYPDTKISPADGSSNLNYSDTVYPDTFLLDTNNNRIQTKTVLNNSFSPSHFASSQFSVERSTDELLVDLSDSVLSDLHHSRGIPFSYSSDPERLKVAIRLLFDWDSFSDLLLYSGSDATARYQLYFLLIDCLEEMCSLGNFTYIKGAQISYSKVIEALNRILTMNSDPLIGYECSAAFLVDRIVDKFLNRARETRIKNEKAYLKALIWTELTTSDISDLSSVLHDFENKFDC